MDWNDKINADDVRAAFRLILGRDVDSDTYPAKLEQARLSVSTLITSLIESDEFAQRHARRIAEKSSDGSANPFVDNAVYRTPSTFRVTPAPPPSVLLLGSCLTETWESVLGDLADGPRLTRFNVLDLPQIGAEEAATFDFQIIQIPLRVVIPEGVIYKIAANDEAALAEALDYSCRQLAAIVDGALRFQREFGIPAFVLNFLPPQQNLLGRMAPRYALSNPVYFVEQINRRLDELLAGRPGVYPVDFDQIVANFGRRRFQDDLTHQSNHGSSLGSLVMEWDAGRLEPIGEVHRFYGTTEWGHIVALYREIEGMYRTIRQVDAIKIVIFDLDDTMWRGVAADSDLVDSQMIEGWPLAMVEAASYLWRRGIALAIVSKNDEEVATRAWNRLYGRIFPIENFVVRKINWEPKAANIQAILRAVNLLPGNALFVDDNPVERAAVKAALPEIRVMDAPLAAWRRNLLWSPELQTATFTAEAGRRTEMLQKQIERDATRDAGDHQAFLAALELRLGADVVTAESDARFPRCYDLINKTNQFNTTGQRWSPAEMSALLAGGGALIAITASDRFTDYGIVAVAAMRGDEIVQVVMSCRVFGMGVEQALMSVMLARLRLAGLDEARGTVADTGRNRLSMTYFETAGFAESAPGQWHRVIGDGLAVPPHIAGLETAAPVAA